MRIINAVCSIITLSALMIISAPVDSDALPSYARNSGESCFSCHSGSDSTSGSIDRLLMEDRSNNKMDPVSGLNLKAGLKVHTYPAQKFGAELVPAGYRDDQNLSGLSGYIGVGNFEASLGFMGGSGANPLYANHASDSALWYRLAYAPTIGDFGLSFGVMGFSSQYNSANFGREAVSGLAEGKSYGLDANINGKIGKLTLAFTAVYLNYDDDLSNAILSNTSDSFSSDAFRASAKVGYKTFGMDAEYKTYKPFENPARLDELVAENYASIGAKLDIADNVTLRSQYSTFGVDKEVIKENSEFRLGVYTGF